MKRTAGGVVLVSILVVSTMVFADIPFNTQNQSGKPMCFYCGGPWLRYGEAPFPLSIGTFQNWYSAETNIFSPFGPWGCGFRDAEATERDCSFLGKFPTQTTTFCVADVPGVQVNLTIKPDGSVTSDKPPQNPGGGCYDSAVFSFLGDSPAGPQYEGTYRFAGKGNEQVKVTLDRDGTRGSEGEIAQLTLRHAHGARLQRLVSAVPITVTATLPKDGNYEVTVAYPPDGTRKPFRGYYQLDVTTPNQETIVLEPVNP